MSERASGFVRKTRPLSGEEVAVLCILQRASRPLNQATIQAATGPEGEQVSVADACDFLESMVFMKRETPKRAEFVITRDGELALEKHKARAIRDLKLRVEKMESPHPRDKSRLPEEHVKPFKRLLMSLETGKFGSTKARGFEEDDSGPVTVSRALNTAKAQRDADLPEDPELNELDDNDDAAPAAEKLSRKLSRDTGKAARSIKTGRRTARV